MCLAPLIWALILEEQSSKILFNFFSKLSKQLYRIPAQSGNSITSSKMSVSSLLNGTFKLLSLSRLNHVSIAQKTLLIVVLVFKISFACKNKVNYVISILIVYNIWKLVFLWPTTRAIAYAAIINKLIKETCKKAFFRFDNIIMNKLIV